MILKILIFNLFLLCSLLLNDKIAEEKKNLKSESIYFFYKTQFFKSSLIVWSVILGFLVVYRIYRFIFNKNLYFNLLTLSTNFWNLKLDKIILTMFVIFIISIILKLRYLAKCYVKKHFLKLHYYYFLRFKYYAVFNKIIFSFNWDNKKYILNIIINDLVKYVVILVFFKNLVFDKGVIYTGLLPWYGLYYLCLNFVKFLNQMESDFEKVSLQFYYSTNYCVNVTQLRKLYYYHNNLVFGENNYKFVSNSLFLENYEYPKNWIFIIDKPIDDEIYITANKNDPEMFPFKIGTS